MAKKDERVLADHTRKGKRLIPPFIRMAGEKYSPYSWTRQLVPEAIWIWLLIDRHGLDKGARIAGLVGKAASAASRKDPKPLFCKTTSFAELSAEEKAEARRSLGAPILDDLNAALGAFLDLCADNPLSFLSNGHAPDLVEQESFSRSLDALYDRYGRATAVTLATVTLISLDQDKLRVSDHLWDKLVEDFHHIAEYPSTERSKSAAASFRAGAPMTLMMGDDGFEHDDKWLEYFWGRVGTIGSCVSSIPTLDDEPIPDDDILGKIIFSYRNAARRELKERLEAWKLDLHNIETSEVVSALLSRQATLALELAIAPSTWNPHTAPLILRAMADVFITLAWILSSRSKERAARFVEDGLGAVKLEIALRKKALEAGDESVDTEAVQYAEMLQSWLDAQRMDQFVEVNLGSWSGMSTRAMAEEAGYLDFYNYVYQPFSSAVHSNWFHVSGFNSAMCENPAHRHHRMGRLLDFELDPHWLYLAAKYLRKALALFDEKTSIVVSAPSSFELLLRMLDEVNLYESHDNDATDEGGVHGRHEERT